MENTQLGLETQLRDKKYIQLGDIQKLHLEIKDKAILNPGEESIIEKEIENVEEWNIVRAKEVDIENEIELKTIDESNQLNELLKIENKEIEELSKEIKEKLKLEKKEKIYIKKVKNYKLKGELKLNKGFQINNIKNSLHINDELIVITEKNNNTLKNYIINLLFLLFHYILIVLREEKRREEKRREEKKLYQGRRRE